MQSLGSWIDIEELEVLTRTLIERERQIKAAATDCPPDGGQTAAADGPTDGDSGHTAAAAAGGSAPEGTAQAEAAVSGDPDDLATKSGPVDAVLVERVRLKLQALVGEIGEEAAPMGISPRQSAQKPDPAADTGSGQLADAGGFEVSAGTLLQRLDQFAGWAADRAGIARRGHARGPQ